MSATTLSLEERRGMTSVLMVFMSISLLGLLAKWLSLVSEALLAALVRGVVLRKKAALVLPTLAGDPGSMIRPGLFWISLALMLLSMMKQSSVVTTADDHLPYFLYELQLYLVISGYASQSLPRIMTSLLGPVTLCVFLV